MTRKRRLNTLSPLYSITLQTLDMIKDRLYEYINTVYDHDMMDGANTIAVLHDLKYMKYIAVNVDKDPIGNKEITIL